MAVPTVWSQGVVSDGPSRSGAAQAATSKLYLIEFDEPGALHYDGGVGSLAATAPRITGDRLFNAQSVEVSAYVNYLETAVAGHIAAMNAGLGRQARVSHKYFYTHSGIAAELSEQEARDVARMPGVKSVVAEQFDELNTFRGPEFIGAGTVWNLPLPGGSTNRGAGVRIAILDSGANSAHPSFADDASCGFSVSNPKLVALSCATATGPGGACDGPNPQADAVSSSHGVHTAGIAGGNTLIAASTTPAPILPTPFTQMSGVAPCAGINSYKVCNESDGRCSTAHSASAVNNAIAAVSTGVKVLNFSISGGTSPWTTGDNDRNFLDAVNAGIFVAASAGNTSTTITNPVGQVNHRGPWTMTVANSYHDLNPAAKISIVAPTAVAGLQNIIMNKGSTTPEGSLLTANPIRSYPTNIAGCTDTGAFPASYFSGAIALVRRGATAPSTTACSFSEKITNAFNAGAVAVVVVNNQAGSISMDTTGAPSVPAYSVSSQAIADNLIAHLAANPTTSAATFDPSGRLPDKLNDGSLRGPTPGTLADLTKPDISGPGTSIYAPARTDDGSYIYLSGTSMSGPHLAGSGALVRAVRPSWTPMEVKSALQMTAKRNGWKDDGTVPWDADDAGSGRVDLTKATSAGLVMDETYANFLAANPSGGSINIKALNLPSVRNMACDPNCTFTRTVKSTLSATSTWNVSFDTTSGIAAVVTPATFTLAAGATQVLNITVTPGAYGPPLAAPNAPGFGYVVLTEAAAQSPAEHITVAVRGGRDGIFKDGFETGVVVNPDIVSFNGVNFTFPANGTGGSIQWINGTTCACDTTPYNFNVYSDTAGTALQFYFPAQTPAASFGAVASGSVYSVLAPGAVVGPSATFYAGTAAAATVNWRPGTNLDGYLGFRFYNTTTSAINYGYARITSTAPNGHPFRIVGYAYNKAGAAITISSIP
jgi:subtilisin family serine protease